MPKLFEVTAIRFKSCFLKRKSLISKLYDCGENNEHIQGTTAEKYMEDFYY